MAAREIDAISTAIIETEREIAGDAWDQEETERDDSGTALESMGEGLEGQHEADDDEDADGEDAEGTEESDAEGEADDAQADAAVAAAATAAAKDGKGEQAPEPKPGQTEGRVPSGKLREVAERARAAEAERDRLKTELETAKAQGAPRSELDALKSQVSTLTQLLQGQRQPPQATEAPKAEVVPDIFEDPKGFVEHLTKGFTAEISKRDTQLAATRVENSMAIAHAFHKDTFEKAFDAINKLNPQNPDDRATVQKIYSSPNPGEALVGWHKRSQTLARVGDDPDAFVANVQRETREALIKDPEFRKQLIAELRGEAQAGGTDGQPRTENRLPRSLARAGGSNLGADRPDPHARDDSEQSVADHAWRT
jgi:hypothetical protein